MKNSICDRAGEHAATADELADRLPAEQCLNLIAHAMKLRKSGIRVNDCVLEVLWARTRRGCVV